MPRTFDAAGYRALFSAAHRAGMQAAETVHPAPMRITGPTGRVHTVPDGPCGYAWVHIQPGTCALAQAARTHLHARRNRRLGGVEIPVHLGTQSYTRKLAYAEAFAAHLREETREPRVMSVGWLD